MRKSFRSRSRSTSSISLSTSAPTDIANDRKKIVQSLNREAGMKERGGARGRGGGRGRVQSELVTAGGRGERSQSPLGSDQVPAEMMGVVSHLNFAETFVSGQLGLNVASRERGGLKVGLKREGERGYLEAL